MSVSDDEIMCALIGQVSKAMVAAQKTKPAASETDVITYVTRPMWNAFCRAVKVPENSKPTGWNGIHGTIRIFGSETKIIESSEMWSYSKPRK